MHRKQRKAARERRKLRDKLALNMVIRGDTITQTDDISLFDLKKIKSHQALKQVEESKVPTQAEAEDDDVSDGEISRLPKYVKYNIDDAPGGDDDDHDDDVDAEGSGSDDDVSSDEEEGEMDEAETTANPLVVNLESRDVRTKRKTDMWFGKVKDTPCVVFANLSLKQFLGELLFISFSVIVFRGHLKDWTLTTTKISRLKL